MKENMYGFKKISQDYIEDIKANAFYYIHENTGLKVYYVDSDDRESFFSYHFSTPPTDSTGVFHIIEHTVLAGSKKYPVKDPFMELNKGSANTYLNALTYPDKTMYPAASTVRKDFDNLFSVYTDSLFNPLLRKESFMSEGIRREADHFDGVVFNEMMGDSFQMDSLVYSHTSRDLFSVGPYQYDSGGNPNDITKLTFEDYKEAYEKHYTPSNAILYIYGKYAGFEEKLEILEKEYLPKYTKANTVKLYEGQVRWDSPRVKEIKAEKDEDDEENLSNINISWLTVKNTDPLENITANVLVDILLGNPSCPLYRGIIESGLAKDLSNASGLAAEFYEIPFFVGFSGIEKEKRKEAEECVLNILKDLVKNGIDKDIMESSLRRFEFSLLEVPGGIPFGMRLSQRIFRNLERNINPAEQLRQKKQFENLRRKTEEDPFYFEKWIEKNLINNPHRLTLVAVKEDGFIEKEVERINSNLENVPFNEKDIELYEKFSSLEDSQEDKDKVPKLKLEDITVSLSKIESTQIDNIYHQDIFTGGVIYFDLAFDINDFTLEELRLLNVVTRVLTMTGHSGKDYQKCLTDLRLNTGSCIFYLESGRDTEGNAKCYFINRVKLLPRYFKDGIENVSNYLMNADIAKEDRIVASLQDLLSDYENSVIMYGNSFVESAATASFSTSLTIGEELMGITSWVYYKSLISKDMNTLKTELDRIYKKLNNKNRLTLTITSSKEDYDLIKDDTNKFLTSFNSSPLSTADNKTVSEEIKTKAFIAPTKVNYNALAIKSSSWLTRDVEAEFLLSKIITPNELWDLVRSKGGAYGVSLNLDPLEGTLVFSSYRDPRCLKTFEDFSKALKEMKITVEEMNLAKLQILSTYFKPISPAAKAITGFRRRVYILTDEMRKLRQEILIDLNIDDLDKTREAVYNRLSVENIKVSMLSKDSYKKEKLDWKTFKLPY